MININNKFNLKGQKFGKLIVLNETNNPSNKKKNITFWDCLCECGNHTIANTSSLRSSKKYQCKECGQKKSGLARRKDLTGKRFGKLVVQEMIYGEKSNSGKQRTYCICKCDCGNIIKRSIDGLNNNTLHSCGCARKEISDKLSIDIIGNKYGRLTVIKEDCSISPRRVTCQCECGNIINVVKTDIMNYHTLSCGCLQSEMASKSNLKDWTGTVSDYGIELLKQSYKRNNKTWIWKCKCFCGEIFDALPADVLSGKITSCGCKKCSSKELLISNILKDLNCNYDTEYRFNDCKDIYTLPFDFIIYKDNKIKMIEYDGEQHYKSINWFGGEEEFQKRIKHDKIKTDYCKENNIPLLRLKYTLTNDEIKHKIIEFIAP